MDAKMTQNVIDIVSGSFFQKKEISERCAYIKSRLMEYYHNIGWSVFIYSNGYCKVSYDGNLYICGKANDYYIIIFGHNLNNAVSH